MIPKTSPGSHSFPLWNLVEAFTHIYITFSYNGRFYGQIKRKKKEQNIQQTYICRDEEGKWNL